MQKLEKIIFDFKYLNKVNEVNFKKIQIVLGNNLRR